MASSNPLNRGRARLLWYGLGLALLLSQSLSFVPAPGAARGSSQSHSATASGIVAASVMMPTEAWAKGGQWGPLEGKASSLVHPIVMASLFFATLYAGFLGWQWRQTREMGTELSALRKKLPKGKTEEEDSPAVKALKEQISKLDAERKEMVQAGYKDKHYTMSSILLGGGVFFTCYFLSQWENFQGFFCFLSWSL